MASENETGGKGNPAEAATRQFQAAGEALKGAGAKAAENSAAVSQAVIDHAEQNTREAFAALRAAARVTSVTDLMKVQGDYVREQSNRSMEQARQIGDLIAQMGKSMMSPFGGGKG